MSENQNTINFLKGMIKGYFIGKKGTNLNIQSLLDKIKELMELEKNTNSSTTEETTSSSTTEETTSSSTTEETTSYSTPLIATNQETNNVKEQNDLLCLEVNEINVEKIDTEVLELNRKMKRATNQLNILKQKSRSMKINNRNKLNAIFNGLTTQINQYKKRLFNIKNFYDKNEIRTKKDIWNLLKHAQKIIDFITKYKIEYTDDPLVFKSIILTMYKKNFNMIDLQGKFLNVKTILDLHFNEGNINNFDFYFETIDGKECIKYRTKNSINLNQLNQENITTDIIRKKNLSDNLEKIEENEDEEEEEEEVEEDEEENEDEEELMKKK
jgi:hypothetical protein